MVVQWCFAHHFKVSNSSTSLGVATCAIVKTWYIVLWCYIVYGHPVLNIQTSGVVTSQIEHGLIIPIPHRKRTHFDCDTAAPLRYGARSQWPEAAASNRCPSTMDDPGSAKSCILLWGYMIIYNNYIYIRNQWSYIIMIMVGSPGFFWGKSLAPPTLEHVFSASFPWEHIGTIHWLRSC